MSKRPKVFILNKGAHDYSDAERFGDLVFLTEGYIHVHDPNSLFLQLEEALDQVTEDDYLVVSSFPILNLLAGILLCERVEKLNLLIYKQGSYIERNLSLNN